MPHQLHSTGWHLTRQGTFTALRAQPDDESDVGDETAPMSTSYDDCTVFRHLRQT